MSETQGAGERGHGGGETTLTDEEIETRILDAGAARASSVQDDADDPGDTGDDAGDVSDSGDDSGGSSDSGDDSGSD